MTFFTDGGARLHVTVQQDSGRMTVTLTGELDRVSGPSLADVLDAAMDADVGHVWVSMAQVGFVDVAGVRTLVHAHRLGARRGVVLRLRDPQPHVAWLLRETEAADLLLGAATAPVAELGRRVAPAVLPGDPSAAVPHAAGDRRKQAGADGRHARDGSTHARDATHGRDRDSDMPAWDHGTGADERDRQADERDQRAHERDQRAYERDRRADERDKLADQRARKADERDKRADHRDDRADHRDEQADDRDRLAQERSDLLDERQQKAAEHQRWEDVREDLADARERDLDRREQSR